MFAVGSLINIGPESRVLTHLRRGHIGDFFRGGLTGDDFGTLKVLVGMKIARGQSEPEADDEKEKISSAPHVDIGFFLLSPAQAPAWPCLWFGGRFLIRWQASCIRHIQR